MGARSKIEWTEATWNPMLGCTKVSPGCGIGGGGCYAIREANMHASHPNAKIAAAYAGLVKRTPGGVLDWTGKVNLIPSRLNQPLRWKRPRRIFVNSQTDLFHDQVPDEYIAEVFAVMALAPQHTFQILTKRHGRMRSLLCSAAFLLAFNRELVARHGGWPQHITAATGVLPLPNVWLGVSVEDQQFADIRIPALLETPAAVRFLSCEPLLGPVAITSGLRPDAGGFCERHFSWLCQAGQGACNSGGLDWVIVGGESGPGARPMHPDWARSLRDQCVAAGVPFSFKQWGEWAPAPWKVEREPGENDEVYKARAEQIGATHVHTHTTYQDDAGHTVWHLYEPDYKPWSVERQSLTRPHAPIRRVGKRAAGRLLDGTLWDQYPEVKTSA